MPVASPQIRSGWSRTGRPRNGEPAARVGIGEWSDWFALARAANLIRYRCNSSAAMWNAVKNGVGIGLLPTYICEFAEGIVPIVLDVRTFSYIWLAYHAELRDTARVRVVIDWIRSLFDDSRWPWFRDEFHTPELPSVSSSTT